MQIGIDSFASEPYRSRDGTDSKYFGPVGEPAGWDCPGGRSRSRYVWRGRTSSAGVSGCGSADHSGGCGGTDEADSAEQCGDGGWKTMTRCLRRSWICC